MRAAEKFKRRLASEFRKRNELVGRLLGRVLRLLGSTLRVAVMGAEHIRDAEAMARQGRGSLFLVWHGSLIIPAILTRDRGYSVLISPSADGGMAAAAMQTLGWQVQRGSPFAGGAMGARGILRILRTGAVVAITPDGPRGPARELPDNLLRLVQSANCDIYPVGAATGGAQLKTWDKLKVPTPFSRAAMVVGAPLTLIGDELPFLSTEKIRRAIECCEADAELMLARQMRMRRNRRKYLLWNLLVASLAPALVLYTLWRRYGLHRSAASFKGQWGHVPAEAVRRFTDGGAPHIWIHAVSVGEAMAARPVARALRTLMPECRIGLSVTTDTGYQTAKATLDKAEIDALWYFPLDLPFPMRRAFRQLRPDAFITIETEIWPNCLSIAQQEGVKTFLVNGRVSDNLVAKVPRLSWLWSWMMSNIDAALMRSQFDGDRLRALPGPPKNIMTIGDVKLDDSAGPIGIAEERTKWRMLLGIDEETLLWVAGSTHEGEESSVLRVYSRLQKEYSSLRLVLAPRHVERVADVQQEIAAQKFSSVKRSMLPQALNDSPIILLDTVGELAQLYSAADVAFVGGSLIQRGGHNMLEPVLRGVPVVYGPHIANFREAAKLVESARAGQAVQNETELYDVMKRWLSQPEFRAGVAQRATLALAPHQGAAMRAAKIIAESLQQKH